MPTTEDIFWFKQQFHDKIEAAIRGTPFSLDMITAVACQETGFIWQTLRKRSLSTERILELCVGDTIDARTNNKGRRAFPKTKAELLSKPRGDQMFVIARQALVDMAAHIPGYESAVANPNKFCHGFGIFQFDLQFFLKEPDYFLQKRYADFDATLEKCVGELRNAMRRINFEGKATLSELEMAAVAIAYNTGGFKPSKGLKQGHFDGKKFYGENFFDYMRLSKSVALEGEPAGPTPGTAPVPPPSPVEATGKLFEVDVRESPLRLRSEPVINRNKPNGNIIAHLPDGHIVQAVTGKKVNEFLEVETSLLGAHLKGFAAARFLKPASGVDAVPVLTPAVAPTGSVVAIHMPRKPGSVTTRAGIATAHTLNEAGAPGRKGATPDELRAELAEIVNWLAVDKSTHLRYKSRNGLTFCNIYAHDFCHLAGVYLPRVWWTPGAIEALSQGQTVQPLLGNTIEEVRANNLFRWLRDFGLRFGWRQTGTLTKLQTEVNQGAIGLIVARRKEDGRSGHIVIVVPETGEHSARRNAAGEVIAPLQSQAGLTNFRYGTGILDWWKGNQFADSAFWLHS